MAPTLSADAFAALARSSPWRWSTLRFTVSWPADPWRTGAVRAWLRRPDRLRVETLDGGRLQVVREAASPDRPLPVLRPDGLVASRPDSRGSAGDDPMYQDYHWVAMLDPVELADGNGSEDGLLDPLSIESVAEVEHGGRRAWEAIVDPAPEYEPRCGCCPLLRSLLVDGREWGADSDKLLDEYPEVYRVRLDVETGVCVRTEAIGGSIAGAGHDLRIEAVDEPMDDGMFVQPRWPRSTGWSVGPGRVD
jgi:hypothetical protein